MPIRRRISKFKKLPYHVRFGPMESPPVQDNSRWGGQAWPPNNCFAVSPVGLIVPKGAKFDYGFPKKVKLDVANVIIGLLRNHDNQRNGIGPGQGFSGWVATKIIVRERRGYTDFYFEVDPKTGKRKPMSRADLMACWKYSARAEPKRPFVLSDYDYAYRLPVEMDLEAEALDGIYLDYEEIHGVNFPWKAMRYRRARKRS